MIHKGRGISAKDLSGSNWHPNDTKVTRNTPPKILSQLSNAYQRVNVGYSNRFDVDKFGVVIGIKENPVLYSCS